MSVFTTVKMLADCVCLCTDSLGIHLSSYECENNLLHRNTNKIGGQASTMECFSTNPKAGTVCPCEVLIEECVLDLYHKKAPRETQCQI